MASMIWLNLPEKTDDDDRADQMPLNKCITANISPNKGYRDIGGRAVIAKGNRIDGHEAKE